MNLNDDNSVKEVSAQFRHAKALVRRMSKELQRQPLSLMELAFVNAIIQGSIAVSIPVNYGLTKEQTEEVLATAKAICDNIARTAKSVTVFKDADDEGGTSMSRDSIRAEFGV